MSRKRNKRVNRLLDGDYEALSHKEDVIESIRRRVRVGGSPSKHECQILFARIKYLEEYVEELEETVGNYVRKESEAIFTPEVTEKLLAVWNNRPPGCNVVHPFEKDPYAPLNFDDEEDAS